MKTVSIGELHASTGRIVRSVEDGPMVVTDRGKPVAVLTSSGIAGGGEVRRLPTGHWESKKRPVVNVESTQVISEDRER